MKNKTYVILGIIIIAIVIGSLSTLLSARRLAEQNSSAPDIYKAFIASHAGIEAAKCYIETNQITHAGKLPMTFHLNGALFEVTWSEYNSENSSISIASNGAVLIDDMIIEKSILDTTVTINFRHPSGLNPAAYFGN